MSNRGQSRERVEPSKRLNGEGPKRSIRTVDRLVVLALVIAGIALVAGCGAKSTDAPTVVVVLTTAAPEVPPATKPADTATPTASSTPVPTLTEAPTDTPSPVPPTDTPPIPTATATPVPSDTPLPTDTPVPPTDTVAAPTRTAVPPTATAAAPTRTPAPPPPQFPWRGQVVNTFSNCALTQVMGLTLDRNGGIAGDIWVHFWADGWEGAWARSSWTVNEGYAGLDDSSNWDGVLDHYAKAGTWNVCVVPAEGSWDCRSTTVTAQTVAEPCAPDSGGVQIVRIVFQQN
jgi:hypothetical protein